MVLSTRKRRAGPGRKPLRVLVVDDDADNRFGLLLRLWDFGVGPCERGSEALAIADGFGPQVARLNRRLGRRA
jgi:hypothetical protein